MINGVLLQEAKVNAVDIHDIYTFLCSPKAIFALESTRTAPCASQRASVALPQRDDHVIKELNYRPLLDRGNWKEALGFIPTYQVPRSTLVAACGDFCLRMLRQGLGLITKTSEATADKDFIEKRCLPRQPELKKRSDRRTDKDTRSDISVLIEYAKGVLQLEGGEAEEESSYPDGVVPFREPLGKLSFDWQAGLDFGESVPYRVFELVFENNSKAFEDLAKEIPPEASLDERPATYKLVFYCLTRSYDAKNEGLPNVANLTNLRVFEDIARPNCGEGLPVLQNYCQNERFFITLGPRGAVVAYEEKHREAYEFLRVSALNMIEILRGRYHNLVAARTILDNTIRRLGVEALNDHESKGEDDLRCILKLMMEANFIYGLVVSDPGVYLLDGSTLSHLDSLAQKYLHLRTLREDTALKMEALQRFWSEYQDQRRHDIISAMSSREFGKRSGGS